MKPSIDFKIKEMSQALASFAVLCDVAARDVEKIGKLLMPKTLNRKQSLMYLKLIKCSSN